MRLVWREVLLGFRRMPLLSLLSILMIAVSLFSVSLFGLVAINLRHSLSGLAERVEVVAFLLRGTPTETITLAAEDITAFPEVLAVRYVSEDEALERAREELVEFREAYQDLATNPLPASLEIRLHPEFRTGTAAQAVAERLRGYGFIDDVRFGQEWVERLDRIRALAGIVGLATGIAFAFVAIVIIGVTIRMTILQRAREIAIMRLVGATDSFIRRPFLLEGALRGLGGGLLALALSWLTLAGFRQMMGMTFTDLVFFTPAEGALLAGFGVVIGLGGSLVSVRRHLREVR